MFLSLKEVLNLHNCLDGSIKYLIHITTGITWSITGILTLVKGSDKLVDGIRIHATLRKSQTDILTRELGDRHIELVAHISPEGTQHLIIELALLACLQQLVSLTQTTDSDLVGTLATHLPDIGILYRTMAEDDEEGDEDGKEDGKTDPIEDGAEEIVVHLTKT